MKKVKIIIIVSVLCILLCYAVQKSRQIQYSLLDTIVNYSQVSRHKKAFFRGAGYFVYSQYKASASFGVSILSVPCGLFVL